MLLYFCKDKREVILLSPKMGRPTNNPRTIKLNIRLSEKESVMLQECADIMNVARVNVIVKGIEMVRAELEKK